MAILRDFMQQDGPDISTLKGIANKISNTAKRNEGEGVKVMYQRVYQSALSAAKVKNLALLSAAEQSVTDKWANDEFSSSIIALAEKKASESTVEEVAVRADKDPFVQEVVGELLQVSKEKLCVDLTKHLEQKVGVFGVDFRRSGKVKSFNKKW